MNINITILQMVKRKRTTRQNKRIEFSFDLEAELWRL